MPVPVSIGAIVHNDLTSHSILARALALLQKCRNQLVADRSNAIAACIWIVSAVCGFVVGASKSHAWGLRHGFFPVHFGRDNPKWSRSSWSLKELDVLRSWQADGGVCEHYPAIGDNNFLGTMETERGVMAQWVTCQSAYEVRVKGLVHFGPDTEGQPRCVHGGCTASVAAAASSYALFCATGDLQESQALELNYRRFVTIGSTLRVQAWIQNRTGQHLNVHFEMKDIWDRVVHVDGMSQFTLKEK